MKRHTANSIIKTAQDISKFVRHNTLTSFEQKNVQRDIDIMYSRIIGRQYVETDFVDRNRFDAGRRTEEFFQYMEGYIQQSKRWENILKQMLTQHKISSITDICPGWAPKIELALGHLQYTGSVTLYDQDTKAMKRLTSFIHNFCPNLRIRSHKGNVLSKTAKPQGDLTVCNHIIDDIILSLYARNERIPLHTLYKSEASFIQITQRISNNPTFIKKAAESIAISLLRFLKKDSHCIIAQYPGLTESSLELITWIQQIKTVTKDIVATIKNEGVNAQLLH